MKFDVVVTGSGLGGLLCAYILSREGYNVCLIEKNPQLGGCMQTFRPKILYSIQACITSVVWMKDRS